MGPWGEGARGVIWGLGEREVLRLEGGGLWAWGGVRVLGGFSGVFGGLGVWGIICGEHEGVAMKWRLRDGQLVSRCHNVCYQQFPANSSRKFTWRDTFHSQSPHQQKKNSWIWFSCRGNFFSAFFSSCLFCMTVTCGSRKKCSPKSLRKERRWSQECVTKSSWGERCGCSHKTRLA